MKPWLLLSPKVAHDLAPLALQALAAFREPQAYEWKPFHWRGLEFKNRLGIAGGVDKDGSRIEDWWTFGPGFIEIGTVTPKPQGPNDGSIFDRDATHRALWNRMGFPGLGAHAVRENLRDLPPNRVTPIFVNIGKNRATANENAARDYIECIEILGETADAIVVNISSPNTTGLRELFQKENLLRFLGPICNARERLARKSPLLLKLSPDLTDQDLVTVIEQSCSLGLDGWIATNTTASRDSRMRFPIEGGVSGQPLAERSKKMLMQVSQILGEKRKGRLLVSAGGVMTPEDVHERIDLGADLVQVYSALVFEGPWFFSQVARFMSSRA